MITAGDKPIELYLSDYSVSFCCEHMIVTVSVQVEVMSLNDDDDNENKAVFMADKIIADYYGFSPMGFCHETNVDYCGRVL